MWPAYQPCVLHLLTLKKKGRPMAAPSSNLTCEWTLDTTVEQYDNRNNAAREQHCTRFDCCMYPAIPASRTFFDFIHLISPHLI
jgi:hypothetical protein